MLDGNCAYIYSNLTRVVKNNTCEITKTNVTGSASGHIDHLPLFAVFFAQIKAVIFSPSVFFFGRYWSVRERCICALYTSFMGLL